MSIFSKILGGAILDDFRFKGEGFIANPPLVIPGIYFSISILFRLAQDFHFKRG